MLPNKILTNRGYSIAKTAVAPLFKARIEKELTVKPIVQQAYAGTVKPFKLWIESATRYYLPQAWAKKTFGDADADVRSNGRKLSDDLKFGGSLRQHQIDALAALHKNSNNGIICLPCGYGKTFTGIAAALSNGVAFIVVVHKEFLADQWTEELKRLVPGIRIGRIQGDACDVGTDFDVSIAMIQTLCSRNYPSGTFDNFGFAIFDEVHHLGAEHFSKSLHHINCKSRLGLTATPKRNDGLSKVFAYFIGDIVYEINKRPKDDTVIVETMKYTSTDPEYADVPVDWKGDTVRARLINQIADYMPRTNAILDWITPLMGEHDSRKLLVLSDRREHLKQFEAGFKLRGIDSVGYYVGGMKQKHLDISAEKRIILGTFAMASEGMNIPTLNMVLLATPKSNIEQSVGRILRQKKEDRLIQPMILDVADQVFTDCMRQFWKRRKFYKECGYLIRWMGEVESTVTSVDDVDGASDTPETDSKTCLLITEDDY